MLGVTRKMTFNRAAFDNDIKGGEWVKINQFKIKLNKTAYN